MPTAAELQAQIDQYQSWIDNSGWMNAGQRSSILPQYEATLADLQSQLNSLNTSNVSSPTNVSTPTSSNPTTTAPTFTPLSSMSASTQASVSPQALTDQLNDAQALYALRLQQLSESPNSRTRQQRLADAERNLAVAQQNFNVGVVPSSGEALGQTITNPSSLVTQATAPTFSADGINNGLIAAGTGQAGAAPQVGVSTAGLSQVGGVATAGLTQAGAAAQAGYREGQVSTAAPAAQATVPDYVPAETYDAAQVSGAMNDMLNMYGGDFATAELDPRATVQGQLEQLMTQFEGGGTPPWASGAMREAMAVMQKRGLGASSMAGMAVVQAAMEAALPIASQDAQHYLQMQLQNLANEQQSLIFNTQLRANALLSDQAAQNAALQFNAASINQTNQFFAGLEESISRFNADQINSINMFNAAQRNAMEQFNAGQYNQVQMFNTAERNAMAQFNASEANRVAMFNAGETNRVNMFNVGEANANAQFNAAQRNAISQFNAQLQAQREQFNAQNSLIIAQANAQWRQQIALTEFQAQHESNMQAAQLATGLTAAGLDYLWQTERDLMSYAFTASENAQDRRVSLITANMTREIARMEQDSEDRAAFGSVVGSIAAGIFGGGGLF